MKKWFKETLEWLKESFEWFLVFLIFPFLAIYWFIKGIFLGVKLMKEDPYKAMKFRDEWTDSPMDERGDLCDKYFGKKDEG